MHGKIACVSKTPAALFTFGTFFSGMNLFMSFKTSCTIQALTVVLTFKTPLMSRTVHGKIACISKTPATLLTFETFYFCMNLLMLSKIRCITKTLTAIVAFETLRQAMSLQLVQRKIARISKMPAALFTFVRFFFCMNLLVLSKFHCITKTLTAILAFVAL